ncbi:MAG TPA: T9SS type A sorting domain-containing protein, partial [Candidatus Cloacimonadota bacterium]|nr:T9SS type A sorting domain-containing protein [Candidatus Cloacimonadota bacterium]
YVRGNINDSWIKFYTLDEVSSVDNVIAPEIFSLYPIPFRDELNIQIKTKLQKPTNVAVYNIKGQKIRELASDEAKNISWDGKDLFGKNVSSGIYFVRVKQDNQQQIRKVLKIK